MNISHLLIHSPVDRYLGYFQFLAIMTNASMNIHVRVFMQTHAFISLEYWICTLEEN